MTPAKTGRTGRPKLPAGRARSFVISLRFTPDEHAMVEAAAARDKLTVAEWARRAAVSAASGDLDARP